MSIVIQAAIAAFTAAVENPSAQPSLSALRQSQKVLFADLAATLHELPKAADLCVREELTELPYLFTTEVLQRWLRKWPDGVVWPIALDVAELKESRNAPFRLLVMVPMNLSTGGLNVARMQAQRLAGDAWPGRLDEALSKRAALFWGMHGYCDGRWEFAPAAVWTLPGGEVVESVEIPLVSEVASDFVAGDIGIVIHSDR